MRCAALLASALLLLASAGAFAEAPNVAASIKPVHSLVSLVMQGVGEPYLLVKGAASPHSYALKPTDAAALQSAEAVFWIGPDMEAFLEKPLEALAGGARVVALENSAGLAKLPLRQSGHDQTAGPLDQIDPHIWLDPENARLMVREIEQTLREIDPANAAAYKINADKALLDLDALTQELSATLAPVKDKPFITFHDAFRYFENRFGLAASGAIAVSPDAAPGAARVEELRMRVKQLGAVCVFSEPDAAPKIVDVIIEGSGAKTAALDPEASAIAEGPQLYAQSLRQIAAAMAACLSP